MPPGFQAGGVGVFFYMKGDDAEITTPQPIDII